MVTVHVFDTDTGLPLGNAGCQFVHSLYPGDYGWTDQYGNWSADLVPDTNWYLIVALAGYGQFEDWVEIPSMPATIAIALTSRPGTNTVQITIVDGLGNPVRLATVQLTQDPAGYDQLGSTNASGVAPFTFVPLGIYNIHASKIGYNSGQLLGEIIGGDTRLTIPILIPFEITVTAEAGGSTDKPGVTPVMQGDRFTVTASPWAGWYLDGWTVNGAFVDAVGKLNLLLERVDGNFVIIPVFAQIPPGPFYLTLKSSKGLITPNTGIETTPGSGKWRISESKDVIVTATELPLFWYEDNISVQEGGLTYTVTMTKDKVVLASYTPGSSDNLLIYGAIGVVAVAVAAAVLMPTKR